MIPGFRHRIRLFILVCACQVCLLLAGAAPLVIDHTAVNDFDRIPDSILNQIKSSHMELQIIGRSHSTQTSNGLQLLERQNPKYAAEIEYDPSSFNENALRVLNGKYTTSWTSGANRDQYWFVDNGRTITFNTLQRAASLGHRPLLSLWIWSFNARPTYFEYVDPGSLPTYFTDIAGFNANTQINQTRFVYVTVVTDYSAADGDALRVKQYNDQIRQTALAQPDSILFDQGDIEIYDNATNSIPRIVTDMGQQVYVRHTDYNESVAPDTIDGDHCNDALDIRKAKAVWVLAARLAGWTDGGGPTPTPTNTPTETPLPNESKKWLQYQ
jgi:hypothetical protein